MSLLEKLKDEHGVYLVKLARKAVEEYVKRRVKIGVPDDVPKILLEKAGVFVTLNKIVDNHEELRGCIGYILPIKPLAEATIDVAISAATNDPRFPPVRADELDKIIVEVTVLTPPEEIKVSSPEEYPKKIVIGRDGLIIEYGPFSGTLLPQVPVEYGWDAKEFLDNLCLKAGLVPGCWKVKGVKIYAYQGIIWKEVSPRGKIIKVELSKKQ